MEAPDTGRDEVVDLTKIKLAVAHQQDVGRDVLRDIIRRCGIRDVQMFSTCSEMVTALKKAVKKVDIAVVSRDLPGSIDAIKQLREEKGQDLKILVIFSGATKEEVLESIQSGVNDFIIMPYSQATIEDKFFKLMGGKKPTVDPNANIFQRRL